MNKFLQRINFIAYKCSEWTVLLCACAVLCFSLLYTTDFVQRVENDLPVMERQNLPVLLGGALLFGVLLFVLKKYGVLQKHRALFRAALILALAVSLALIFTIRGRATNDALMLDEIINAFMAGNFEAFSDYLAMCPYQVGYVLFGQLIYLVAGPSNFMVYMLLNTASILWMMVCLDRIADLLYENDEVRSIQAVLLYGALFLYAYSTYIYNDVWSIAFQLAAFTELLLYLKKGRNTRRAVLSCVWTAIACLLKTNSIVGLIAMEFGLFVDLCGDEKEWKKKLRSSLIFMAALPLAAYLMKQAVYTGYTLAAGLAAFPKGTSSLAYVAMGMQETEGKYGWYNGFNAGSFRESQQTGVDSSVIAMRAIRESLREFASSKRYFVKFFLMKFLSQWGDPTFISMRELELTARHVENQPAIVESILFGGIAAGMKIVMRIFHFVSYIGFALSLLLSVLRKKGSRFVAGQWMLIVFIFGGICFHELWEASSRYVIRYFLVMLPFASYGIYECLSALERIIKNKVKK